MKHILILLVITFTLLCSPLIAENKFLTFIAEIKGITAKQLHFYDQYLYVSNENIVHIYSLNNPWSPRLETGFEATAPITDIVNLDTNRFYVCSPDPTVRITEIDSLNAFGKIFFVDKLNCTKAEREGAYLYTADANRGLEIYNLGTGLLPYKTATYSEKWGIRDLVARYPRLHALNDFGYVNVDITNTSYPVAGGKNYEVVDGQILTVSDNYAWIGAGSTLIVLDLHDMLNPVIINRFRFNERITSMVVKDSELYIGSESAGLKIMDITDPRNIYNTKNYFIEEGVYSIALNGEYIYLATGKMGWIILRYM